MTRLVFIDTPMTQHQAIAEAKAHRLAGRYDKHGPWETDALGCMFHEKIMSREPAMVVRVPPASYPAFAEQEAGIPASLCNLQNGIFAYLPDELAPHWNERFYAACSPGKDLSRVSGEFMLWILDRCLECAAGAREATNAIRLVSRLYRGRLDGDAMPDDVFRLAEDEAIRANDPVTDWSPFYAAMAAASVARGLEDDALRWTSTAMRCLGMNCPDPFEHFADKLIEMIKAAPRPQAKDE